MTELLVPLILAYTGVYALTHQIAVFPVFLRGAEKAYRLLYTSCQP